MCILRQMVRLKISMLCAITIFVPSGVRMWTCARARVCICTLKSDFEMCLCECVLFAAIVGAVYVLLVDLRQSALYVQITMFFGFHQTFYVYFDPQNNPTTIEIEKKPIWLQFMMKFRIFKMIQLLKLLSIHKFSASISRPQSVWPVTNMRARKSYTFTHKENEGKNIWNDHDVVVDEQ